MKKDTAFNIYYLLSKSGLRPTVKKRGKSYSVRVLTDKKNAEVLKKLYGKRAYIRRKKTPTGRILYNIIVR